MSTRLTEVRVVLEARDKKHRDVSMAAALDLLRLWLDLVESVACKGRPPAAGEQKILLESITRGSINAAQRMPQTHLRAVRSIERATTEHTMALLPRESRQAARRFFDRLGRTQQTLRIVRDPQAKVAGAVLSEPLREVADTLIEGVTTLTGTLRAVGGKEPNLHLDVDGREVIVQVSKEQAKKIATSLYANVTLEVQAWWNAESSELEKCSLLDWEAGPTDSFAEGLASFARSHGKNWRGSNGLEWLRRLRSDKDE